MKKIYVFILILGLFTLGGLFIANAQTSSLVFTQTLRHGTINSVEASKLQEFLIAKGYLLGTPNGMIYQTTSDAIKKFQLANNLSGDGIVGSKTRAILNVLYPAWKNSIGSVGETSICSSAAMQTLIDTTWPQPCNGSNSTECGVRQTGSTKINAYSCYIWAILPQFDDSTPHVLNSAIANVNTNTISYTFPDLHTCRYSSVWTTETCS